MKINRINLPYPAIYIEDFFPNESLLRAAAESYDEVEDYNERIKIIYSEILRISKFSNEEIHEWYWSIVDILKHNYYYFYKTFIPKLKNKLIEDIENTL